jgi:hypothetical protein
VTNTLLEALGFLLITAACVVLVVIAWSVDWRAGSGALAVELLTAGVFMVVVANRNATKRALA